MIGIRRLAVAALPLASCAALLASCAANSEPDPTTAIDGDWHVTEASAASGVLSSAVPPVVAVREVGASIVVTTSCGRLRGSYTFLDDQRASFTLPGLTTEPCETPDYLQELTDAFERIDHWQPSSDDLVFTGPETVIRFHPAG